jgi:hypothetical protein
MNTDFESVIPKEIITINRWGLWKSIPRNDGDKPTKVPFQPNGEPAKTNRADTWTDFHSCLAAYRAGGFSGLAFAFFQEDGLVGIDLDKCLVAPGDDGEGDVLTPYASTVLEAIQSYTEVSPSGTGLHILCRGSIPRPIKKAHIEVYSHGRYFTVTGDPWPGTEPNITEMSSQLHRLCLSETGTPQERAPKQVSEPTDIIPIGARSNELIRFAGELRAKGYGVPLIRECVLLRNRLSCQIPLQEEEIEASIMKSVKNWTPKIISSRDPKEESFAKSKMEGLEAQGFHVDQHGRIKSDWWNLLSLLKATPKRWDLKRDLFTGADESNGSPLSDDDYLKVAEWGSQFHLQHGTCYTRQMARDATQTLCACPSNQYDSLVQWYESLPTWDGVQRVDSLLIDGFGCPEDDYHRTIMRLTLMAGCAYVTHPGMKFDAILVLVGPTGYGKSMFFRTLCPRDAWFCDDVASIDHPDFVRKARGTFIFELAEFCAIRSSDYERTKQALSRQVFTHVAKYQERAIAIPRRFLYTASTNESHPLTDPTGNRRFWMATVHHENTLISTLDIPQIWAEAKHLWESSPKTSGCLALPRELWHHQQRLNETAYLQVDAWEGIIQDYLCHRANPNADFTMKDLLSEDCLDKSAGNLTKSDQTRIGNSLTRLGWVKVRVRVEGNLVYVYRRK